MHLMVMRYCYLLFALISSLLLPAQTEPPPPPPAESPGACGFYLRDVQPVFQVDSCLHLPLDKQRECGQAFMVDYIYSHLRWPRPDTCVEGMVIIGWYIEVDGSVSELSIVRGIEEGQDKVSIMVIADLLQLYPWRPGYQNGRPVRVRYNMPVKWRLE